LHGHSDTVNAVRFLKDPNGSRLLISAGADKMIKSWHLDSLAPAWSSDAHDTSVTTLAVLDHSNLFASAAGTNVKIWKLPVEDSSNLQLQQSIETKFIPMTLALYRLDSKSTILAVAGSHSTIHIYISSGEGPFELSATLSGHSGWIRSLTFTQEDPGRPESDLLLASGSQDKFIRLWRVHKGKELPTATRVDDPALGVIARSVSTKAHRFHAGGEPYSITFEALLLGHDDWVYTCSWQRRNGKLQLLSASADSSLAIWEAEETSGIWISKSRLGEISSQKGSTTATGSAGGFFIGLWAPDGESVVSLGRTGSWRFWRYQSTGQWKQSFGIGGHVRSVTGIAWSRKGEYLLSASQDQTTRLHAQWNSNAISSWHEFARPQIHGYDLNCLDVISDTHFISGADEKPLRVFQQPATVAEILERLCEIRLSSDAALPDAANIPVLGLSNKAIQAIDDAEEKTNGAQDSEEVDPSAFLHKSELFADHPPLEDQLSKLLLWPETQKLYGHGYEISAVSVSPNGQFIATACRASSLDHAVIRIYETNEWKELVPALKAHSLTVTDLQWSPEGDYLLSVGRDRIWSLFARIGEDFSTTTSKGHSRMILGCSWAPVEAGCMFATAGRDKAVKIWVKIDAAFEIQHAISLEHPVTAVAFLPRLVDGRLVLAAGVETGEIFIFLAIPEALEAKTTIAVDIGLGSSKAVNRLMWRPSHHDDKLELAIASEDSSLRILSIEL
jgi:elongator complex protein 2